MPLLLIRHASAAIGATQRASVSRMGDCGQVIKAYTWWNANRKRRGTPPSSKREDHAMWMRIARITFAVALSGQVAVAYAAIPGAGGVISACYDRQGTLRVIDAGAGQACSNKETPLTMNQAGQAGPVGPSDAYVKEFGGFSPFQPNGLEPIVSLEVPAGEYVIEALIRFRANTLHGIERANINCELRADVSGTAELDYFTVSFNAEEYNGYVKLAPMVSWVESPGGFFIHVDCELADGDQRDDIGIDESRLVAVKYGDVHVPPTPPPED